MGYNIHTCISLYTRILPIIYLSRSPLLVENNQSYMDNYYSNNIMNIINFNVMSFGFIIH